MKREEREQRGEMQERAGRGEREESLSRTCVSAEQRPSPGRPAAGTVPVAQRPLPGRPTTEVGGARRRQPSERLGTGPAAGPVLAMASPNLEAPPEEREAPGNAGPSDPAALSLALPARGGGGEVHNIRRIPGLVPHWAGQGNAEAEAGRAASGVGAGAGGGAGGEGRMLPAVATSQSLSAVMPYAMSRARELCRMLDEVDQQGRPQALARGTAGTRSATRVNAGGPTRVNAGGPTRVNAGGPTRVNAGGPTRVNAGGPGSAQSRTRELRSTTPPQLPPPLTATRRHLSHSPPRPRQSCGGPSLKTRSSEDAPRGAVSQPQRSSSSAPLAGNEGAQAEMHGVAREPAAVLLRLGLQTPATAQGADPSALWGGRSQGLGGGGEGAVQQPGLQLHQSTGEASALGHGRLRPHQTGLVLTLSVPVQTGEEEAMDREGEGRGALPGDEGERAYANGAFIASRERDQDRGGSAPTRVPFGTAAIGGSLPAGAASEAVRRSQELCWEMEQVERESRAQASRIMRRNAPAASTAQGIAHTGSQVLQEQGIPRGEGNQSPMQATRASPSTEGNAKEAILDLNEPAPSG